MQEYLDIFDKNERYLGSLTREDCHKPNVKFYHRVVWIWLINNKKEILIQQRAFSKKNRPGSWDEISVAGHVLKDENPEDACSREIYEELGIHVKQLNFLKKWIHEEGREIAYFYSANIEKLVDQFTLQKEEVADARYVTFSEFKDMLNNNIFDNYPIEYKKLVIDTLSNILSK